MTAQSTEPFKGNSYPQSYILASTLAYQWDVGTLEWVKSTGGGGGAVTVADGGDVALGAKADAAWVSGDGTVISILKRIAGSSADLTPSAPAASSVGVASAQAVAANASRKGLLLINTSSARISLGFGSPAVLDSGVTLYPGGAFAMDVYTFDLGAVNAIASGAASNLAVQEYA